MAIPLYSSCNVPAFLTPVPIAPTDWWNPGIYIKPTDTTFQNGFSGTPGNVVFSGTLINELNEVGMDKVQGLKFVVLWGRYETNSTTQNFEQIGAILNAFNAMSPKRRLIVSVAQREFRSNDGFTRLLPADLASSSNNEGLYNWVTGTAAGTVQVQEHKYAWPYKMSASAGSYGYNLKLWNNTNGNLVRTRFKSFITALIDYINAHPYGHLVEHLSETESAIGSPVVPSYSTVDGNGGSSTARRDQMYTAKTDIATHTSAKMIAINKYHLQGLNFDNAYVNERGPLLAAAKSGFSAPDNHVGSSLNVIFKYFKNGTSSQDGKIPLAAEIQEDSYESSIGLDKVNGSRVFDYPNPQWHFDRSVYVGNTHWVISRITAGDYNYWEIGAPGNESMKNFIKTHQAIQNDALRAGGQVTALPTCFNG